MAAKPSELRALVKQMEGLMKEMDSLRGKSEIPTWEKKELKEQRQIERLRKKQEKEKTKPNKPKAAASKPKPKPKAATSKPKPSASRGSVPASRIGGGFGKTTKF